MARLLYHEQNGRSVLAKAYRGSVLPAERIFVDVVSPFERLCLISALVIGSVRVLEQAFAVGKYLLFKAYGVLDLCPLACRLLLTFDMLADLKERVGLGDERCNIDLAVLRSVLCLALSHIDYISFNEISDRALLRAVYSYVRAAVSVAFENENSRSAEVTRLGVGREEGYSRALRKIIGRCGIFGDHVTALLAEKLNCIFAVKSD